MKTDSTNLTVKKAIVERAKAIADKLQPRPSVTSTVEHILEEALAYIESDADTLPPLNFIKDLRQRLGKMSGHEFAQEVQASSQMLEQRLTAIERALKLRPTLYTVEESETPKAAEKHPLKHKK